MADMFDVYDIDGAQIGAIPISPQQRKQLHAGATINITYHTPRMLQGVLGQQNGSFELMEIDGKLVVNDPEQAKRYVAMQIDIARVMKQPDKWTDPDAESNNPIR